ncbi:MAG: hypothetical protein D6761_02860 [Candidatus Dadabacteria bacterium]|nr:MAG: hypothetical protein D6761_02860 [Candidatus Dadabacteria bacterium]
MDLRIKDVENKAFFAQFVARLAVHNLFKDSQFFLPKADYERRYGDFPRYFPGWYLFVPGKDLADGEVIHKKLCGKDLVAYRGKDGRPVIHSDRCPHMDGLFSGGLGEVRDGKLICGYHRYAFENGKPLSGPKEFRSDPKNCIPCHPVREVNGLIMFWFDPDSPEGVGEPKWELDLPDVTHLPRRAFARSIAPTHMAPLHENIVDDQHFMMLHGSDRYRSEPQAYYEKHRFRTKNTMRMKLPDKIGPIPMRREDKAIEIQMDSEFHGLGIHINTVDIEGFEAKVIHCTTPIEDEVTEWTLAVYMPERQWSWKLDTKTIMGLVYPWGMIAQTWYLHTQDRRVFFEKGVYRFYEDVPKGFEKVNMFRRWIQEELMGEPRPMGPNSRATTFVPEKKVKKRVRATKSPAAAATAN